MTYRGYVKKGVILLRGKARLKDGTEVRVEPLKPAKKRSAGKSLGQKMLEIAGTLTGLPRDMAEQHDHYIHGTPKRK